MRKPYQFLRYSTLIFIFPRLSDILLYGEKDLSFEQFSRIIWLYLKEKHENVLDEESPDNTLLKISVKELYEDFLSWWDDLSTNKKNFIVSCGISMLYWMRKEICPRCESATLRRGKGQKVENRTRYPYTCPNKQCSLHNNTQLDWEDCHDRITEETIQYCEDMRKNEQTENV
jgi:Zn-finger nucleic acid-binding protein